jgi:hypothetical protein
MQSDAIRGTISSPDEGGHQMQSEEPSHHLMREAISEATREAIRYIQMQSEAIRCK